MRSGDAAAARTADGVVRVALPVGRDGAAEVDGDCRGHERHPYPPHRAVDGGGRAEIRRDDQRCADTDRSGSRGRSRRGPSDLPPLVSTPANAISEINESGHAEDERQPAFARRRPGIRRRPTANGSTAKHDERRDADESREPFRSGDHLPQIAGGGHPERQQPHQDASRRAPLPADEERGGERRDESGDLGIGAAAKHPVDHDRVVSLARRHRPQDGHIGVRLVGHAHRRLQQVHGVAQVRGRRALEPPDLDHRRQRQRDDDAGHRLAERPPSPVPKPDGQQQSRREEHHLVAQRRARADQRAGNQGAAPDTVGDLSTQANAAVPNATAGACSHPLTA